MVDELTTKEKGFVSDIVKGENGVRAALNNFDTTNYNSAGVLAHEYLNKPKIINAIELALNDEMLKEKHLELMNAMSLDHMTFPVGPKKNETEDDTILSDEEIKEMLSTVGCTVRRIVHGEQARHVYFWTPDNTSRDKALDKAYKIRGKYAAEKHINLNIDAEPNAKVTDLTDKLNG